MTAFPVFGTCIAVGCIDPSFAAYSAIQGSGPICMRAYYGGGGSPPTCMGMREGGGLTRGFL